MDWLYLCIMGWMLARQRQFEEECDCGYVPAPYRRPPAAREITLSWWHRWPGKIVALIFCAIVLVAIVQVCAELHHIAGAAHGN